MKPTESRVSVQVNADNVVLRRGTSSHVTVAKVLGVEKSRGEERIYLDRMAHHPGDYPEGGGTLSGAISTIYTRSITGA